MHLHFSKIGEGQPLVILHGLYGQGDNWMNIARELADNHSVYMIDQRNHGQSPHAPSHTYDDLASDLINFCNSEGLSKIELLGHSMGGKTAITFALKYPGLVQKLVIVDISPFSYLDQKHFEQQVSFHKNVIETFKNVSLEQAKTRSDVETEFSTFINSVSIRRFLLKNLKRTKEGRFYWQLNINALSKNLENIIDAAPPVKLGTKSFVPALFIRGGKSPYISDEEMAAIPDVFTNAKFVTFETAGHWLHAEEPEKFIKVVKEFLL